MKSKTRKLSKEDAAAVDLLLDRGPAASASSRNGHGNGKATAVYASANGASRERVRSAEKVLNLLSWMPAGDPPRDLLKKTLKRVEQTTGAHMPVGVSSLLTSSAHTHA